MFAFATAHARLINNSTVLAVACFTLIIYCFDLKYYFAGLPLAAASEFVSNLFGLALFFIFLVIIWALAFASYRLFYDPSMSLRNYLLSHLRLNVAIIVPWLIFSAVLDIINFLPPSLLEPLQKNVYFSNLLFLILLLALAIFFPWLLIKIWNCRPLPQGFLRERLEDFCARADFKYADIYLWNLFDGKLITAGVLGFIKKFRYLLISPALLKILSEDELESVVAHEIGHIKSRHLIFNIFFILGYVVFAYAFFNILYYGMLSQDVFFNFFLNDDGTIKSGFYIFPTSLLIAFLLLYFRFLFGVFSRNFERQSDLYAIKIVGDGAGIINSLEKIAFAGTHSRSAPSWHHFSIQERIDFIKKCDLNPALIKKHDRRVSRLVALYFIALIVTGTFFYGINSSIINKSELNLICKILEKKIVKDPDNPSFHFILGNVYYEKKLFLKAEKEYLVALELQPFAPEPLNNLAWMYVTSDDENLKKHEEALRLALLAAELSPKPHILDTLAESYFMNGYYQEAAEVIELAISKKPDNIDYYEKQLQKFQSAQDKQIDKDKKTINRGEQISI